MLYGFSKINWETKNLQIISKSCIAINQNVPKEKKKK